MTLLEVKSFNDLLGGEGKRGWQNFFYDYSFDPPKPKGFRLPADTLKLDETINFANQRWVSVESLKPQLEKIVVNNGDMTATPLQLVRRLLEELK